MLTLSAPSSSSMMRNSNSSFCSRSSCDSFRMMASLHSSWCIRSSNSSCLLFSRVCVMPLAVVQMRRDEKIDQKQEEKEKHKAMEWNIIPIEINRVRVFDRDAGKYEKYSAPGMEQLFGITRERRNGAVKETSTFVYFYLIFVLWLFLPCLRKILCAVWMCTMWADLFW